MAESSQNEKLILELRTIHQAVSDVQKRVAGILEDLEAGTETDPHRKEIAKRAIEQLRMLHIRKGGTSSRKRSPAGAE